MKSEKPTLERIAVIAGSAFGLGLSPVLPGTCGALLGVAIHVGIALSLPARLHLMFLTLAFVAVCAANHLLTEWAEAYWNEPDPRHFVLDEVAGYLFVPMLFREGELWKTALAGFVLFRIFDIFKLIPPARLVDRELHGPWGVLLDDLVSAGYAALILHFVHWFGPAGLLGPSS
jgi:phosphatidylglycerophosphatase A